MISEEEFYNDPKNVILLKNQLQLLTNTNVNTQIEDAKQSMKSNLYLQYIHNLTFNTMNYQEGEIEELEDKNEQLTKENIEYKSRFGGLDKETLKKLQESRQLVLVSPSARMNKVLSKMDKVNK